MADSAYPSLPWLIPPLLKNNPTDQEERFNHAHKVTRCRVECTIGILKKRF
ncbi:MAG: transposase family protein [Candidatus Omnitrophica bacterium]|nr:transposase family protein [Candidatus Omnitrophota bacterium]